MHVVVPRPKCTMREIASGFLAGGFFAMCKIFYVYRIQKLQTVFENLGFAYL
jgi:hypothetical protein